MNYSVLYWQGRWSWTRGPPGLCVWLGVAGAIFLGSTHPCVAACQGLAVGPCALGGSWNPWLHLGRSSGCGYSEILRLEDIVGFPYPTHSFDRRQDWLKGRGGNSSGTCSYSPALQIAVLRGVNNPQPQRQVVWRWLYGWVRSRPPLDPLRVIVHAYKETSFADRPMRNLNLISTTVHWFHGFGQII